MSSSEDRKTFMRLAENENGDSYFLFVKAGDEQVSERCPPLPYRLTLAECNQIYSGVLKEKDLSNALISLKMEAKQYYGYINDAFFTDDKTNYSFKLEKLSSGEFRLKLALRRRMGSDWMKVNLCAITLLTQGGDAFKSLFMNIIDEVKCHERRVTELECEKNRLRDLHAQTKEAFESCISAKEEWEKDMYGKFVEVINQKKKVIKSFRENMMDIDEKSSTDSNTKMNVDDDGDKPGPSKVKEDAPMDDDDDAMYMVQVPLKKGGRGKRTAKAKDDPKDSDLIVSTSDTRDPESPPPIRKPPPKRQTRRAQTTRTKHIGYDDDDGIDTKDEPKNIDLVGSTSDTRDPKSPPPTRKPPPKRQTRRAQTTRAKYISDDDDTDIDMKDEPKDVDLVASISDARDTESPPPAQKSPPKRQTRQAQATRTKYISDDDDTDIDMKDEPKDIDLVASTLDAQDTESPPPVRKSPPKRQTHQAKTTRTKLIGYDDDTGEKNELKDIDLVVSTSDTRDIESPPTVRKPAPKRKASEAPTTRMEHISYSDDDETDIDDDPKHLDLVASTSDARDIESPPPVRKTPPKRKESQAPTSRTVHTGYNDDNIDMKDEPKDMDLVANTSKARDTESPPPVRKPPPKRKARRLPACSSTEKIGYDNNDIDAIFDF